MPITTTPPSQVRGAEILDLDVAHLDAAARACLGKASIDDGVGKSSPSEGVSDRLRRPTPAAGE